MDKIYSQDPDSRISHARQLWLLMLASLEAGLWLALADGWSIAMSVRYRYANQKI